MSAWHEQRRVAKERRSAIWEALPDPYAKGVDSSRLQGLTFHQVAKMIDAPSAKVASLLSSMYWYDYTERAGPPWRYRRGAKKPA